MKRVLFILFAALCCMTSCAQFETDCIYQIALATSSEHSSIIEIDGASDVGALVKEFQSACSDLTKTNKNDWMWKTTVRNNDYSSSDADAKAKYNKYDSEISSFMEEWQAKFNSCTDKKSSYSAAFNFKLSRTSESGTSELATKSFTVTSNN